MYTIERAYDSNVAITIQYSEEVSGSQYKLTVTISDSHGIDTELFLYQKNADGTDTFVCVCSPYMLSDDTVYPRSRPVDGFGFYRKNTVTINYTNASDVITNRSDVINQLTTLVNDYGVILGDFSSGTQEIESE